MKQKKRRGQNKHSPMIYWNSNIIFKSNFCNAAKLASSRNLDQTFSIVLKKDF